MAQIAEILQAERGRSSWTEYREIRLYADGSFYRAYEWSAWLCYRYIRQFKPTRKVVKAVDADVVFVGFPQKSLPKIVPKQMEQDEGEGNEIVLRVPEDMLPAEGDLPVMQTDYEHWKSSLEMAATSKTAQHTEAPQLMAVVNNSGPVSLTGVMQQIMAFPIERKSPVECMRFLSDLKEKLATLI